MFKILASCMCLLLLPCKVWGDILDKEGNLRSEVLQVCRVFYPGFTSHPSLEELNIVAQKEFLRPKNSERLSQEAIAHYEKLCAPLSPADQDTILNIFREIGDIDAVYPIYKKPQYILIQGSTISNMRERLMFFASLVEEGRIMLSPDTKIVIATGDRALFDSETEQVLLEPTPFKLREGWKRPDTLPTNELDLGEFSWDQLDLPQFLRERTPLFVKAPKKPGAVRAQTEDAMRSFIENEKILDGSTFLVISSNPFVYYQTRVTEGMFKKLGYGNKGFSFEGAGFAANVGGYEKSTAIGILLDNLARTLYVEKQFRDL